jgi:hypothetical protein
VPQRHKLKPPLTPVTPESFAAWKKNRIEKKAAEQEALEKAKASARAAGKMTGMTGKDMFEFGGELYEDDEEGYDEDWDISRMLARYVSGHGVGGGGHSLDSLRLLFFIVSDLVDQIRVLIC